MNGKFIVLEGIDGSGTTTQAKLLTDYLFERHKRNVILLTREPTDLSAHGQELRRRLKGELLPEEEIIDDSEYWANLFINDRIWHLDNYVIPAVQRGQQVVCDRHKLSTIAYQSAQGHDMNELIKRHERLHKPDLTILLDITAEEAAKRAGTRPGNPEYFDAIGMQKRIRNNYLLAVDRLKHSERIVIIDGAQPIDDVALAIQLEIDSLYGYR